MIEVTKHWDNNTKYLEVLFCYDLTLLEIISFTTNHYATGMQLVVICNYKFGIV
jgi:hypothetical protein